MKRSNMRPSSKEPRSTHLGATLNSTRAIRKPPDRQFGTAIPQNDTPLPHEILPGKGIDNLKWKQVKPTLRIRRRAEVTPIEDAHTHPSVPTGPEATTIKGADIHSIFPTRRRQLFTQAEVVISGRTEYWAFRLAEDRRDIAGSWAEFTKRVNGQGKLKGEAMACYADQYKNQYNFTQAEADAVARGLARVYEKIPIALSRVSTVVATKLLSITVVEVLSNRPQRHVMPTIGLGRGLDLRDKANYGTHIKETNSRPAVKAQVHVLDSGDPEALSKAQWTRFSVFVNPDTLSETLKIPPPHPIFQFTTTEPLEDWTPAKDSIYRQPTKLQMEQAIKLMKHMLSEVVLHTVTKSDAAKVCKDIRARFHETKGEPKVSRELKVNGQVHEPAYIYRGASLFGLEGTGKQRVLVPSKEVREDVEGTLPSIPVSASSLHSICRTIENKWSRSESIVEAWEAGCRKYDMWKARQDQMTVMKSGPKIPRESVAQRPHIRLNQTGRVIENAMALENQETFALVPPLGDLQRRNQRIAMAGSLQAFARESSTDPDNLIWTDAYLARDREEPKLKHLRVTKDLRDPYKRDPQAISVEAAEPVTIVDDQSRIHVVTNVVPTSFYTNMLKFTFPAVVLPIVWLMDNAPDQKEREELLLRFDHLHLIRQQIPYYKKGRLDLPASRQLLERNRSQWRAGIATEVGCKALKQHPWSFYRRSRNASTKTNMKVDTSKLSRVASVIREMDPEGQIPRIGKGKVPYVFEGGPHPAVWTWEVFFAVIAEWLDIMTDECEVDYVTTCTVETLVVALCYQWLHRDDAEFKSWLALPICLYEGHPLMVSVGHRAHKLQMLSGGPVSGEFHSLSDFDFLHEGNIEFTPWITNIAKQAWDVHDNLLTDDFRLNLRASTPWWPHPLPAIPPLPPIPIVFALPNRKVNEVSDIDDLPDVDAAGDDLPAEDDREGYGTHYRALESYGADIVAQLKQSHGATMADVHGSRNAPMTSPPSATEHAPPSVQQQVSLLYCQNMSNLGATCYISSVLQVMFHVSPLRRILDDEFPYSLETGRSLRDFLLVKNVRLLPEQHQQAFETMERYRILVESIKDLFTGLGTASEKTEPRLTRNVLTALGRLDNEWRNEDNDARAVWIFILSRLNTAADKSPRADSWESVRYGARQNRANIAGLPIAPLDEDCSARWTAHLHEGHTSAVTKTMGMQIVNEKACTEPGCIAISRTFFYQPVLVLDLPEDVQVGQTFRLTDLIRSHMDYSLPIDGGGARCPSSDAKTSTHPPMFAVNQKLVRTPEVFAIYVRRDREGFEGDLLSNQISVPDRLDLSEWVNGGEQLPSEKSFGYKRPSGQHTIYRFVAVVVYSRARRHWKSYVRMGSENEGPWVLFDDMMAAPVAEHPSKAKENGFISSMMVFAKDTDRPLEEGDSLFIPEDLDNLFPKPPAEARESSRQPEGNDIGAEGLPSVFKASEVPLPKSRPKSFIFEDDSTDEETSDAQAELDSEIADVVKSIREGDRLAGENLVEMFRRQKELGIALGRSQQREDS